MGCRVFALSEAMPQPANLQRFLGETGCDAPLAVTGDDLGWLAIEIEPVEPASTLRIERYLTDDDELRDELDTWAAFVESRSDSASTTILMQRIVSTRQLFTVRVIPFVGATNTILTIEPIARWFARETDGIYQIDGRGFLTAAGELLMPDD